MEDTNEMTMIFESRPVNEGLARIAAAAFCTQLNPTLEEVSDLKTAVSEAVTNCIIHGYEGEIHKIHMTCRRQGLLPRVHYPSVYFPVCSQPSYTCIYPLHPDGL